jgi:hypothetical protein
MRQAIGAFAGAAVGGLIGWFGATVLFGVTLGNGQAGLAGLIYGGPVGAAIGAAGGWLVARRTERE